MNKLTPRAFEQIGRDLFGHPWAESLARALDVPPKQPLRYAQGGVEIASSRKASSKDRA